MATKYLNLRWKIGGFLVSEIGPVYIGGRTEYVFNIDFDHLSIPELLDYAKDFGLKELGKTYIMPSKGGNLVELTKDRDLLDLGLFLNDGDTIDIYVCNVEGSEDVGLAACHVAGGEASGSQLTRVDISLSRQGEAFNTPTTNEFGTLNSAVSHPNLGYETPLNTTETMEENKEFEDAGSTSEEESGSGEDSDQSIDYGSDVHEELRVVRQDVKTSNRQRRKKNRKEAPTGFLGEAGIDEGYEDIDRGKKDLKDKLGGDEPYYDSSDPDSFVSESEGEAVSDDEEEVNSLGNLRARRKSNKVLHDPTAELVVWQCGMVFENVYQFREALTKYALKKKVQLDKHVNEKNRIRVRCKSGCPWMLYASKEGRSADFTIKTYNPRHKCTKTTINFLCNSKFLAKHYKDRIIQQPTIKGWEIQQLVRKELGVYVGKSICLRTRKLILQEAMGDHVSEFNRILDYKDVLLQTNPGSTCVVKVADVEDGKKEFVGFYICFAAMKKGFMEGCRKCIGIDGCFLKGISKGQLLVAVAKDGNNQMFPVAWAVVATETKATWRWFIKILKEDINLGDGHEVTIISDMQKGLIADVEEVLPECEHRMCARHILSNWAKK